MVHGKMATTSAETRLEKEVAPQSDPSFNPEPTFISRQLSASLRAINNRRLHQVQRQMLAQQLGIRYGNQQAQRLLHTVQRDAGSSGSASASQNPSGAGATPQPGSGGNRVPIVTTSVTATAGSGTAPAPVPGAVAGLPPAPTPAPTPPASSPPANNTAGSASASTNHSASSSSTRTNNSAAGANSSSGANNQSRERLVRLTLQLAPQVPIRIAGPAAERHAPDYLSIQSGLMLTWQGIAAGSRINFFSQPEFDIELAPLLLGSNARSFILQDNLFRLSFFEKIFELAIPAVISLQHGENPQDWAFVFGGGGQFNLSPWGRRPQGWYRNASFFINGWVNEAIPLSVDPRSIDSARPADSGRPTTDVGIGVGARLELNLL